MTTESSRPTSSVVAVTVTFRRPETLANCVRAIGAQTTRPNALVVVDNGGEVDAAELTKRLGDESGGSGIDVLVVRPGDNIGPGGGFCQGFQAATHNFEPDYLWVMDDDIIPQPDALEHLLAATELHDDAGLYWPIVSDPTVTDNRAPGWWGFLIPTIVIEQHGSPRADFVWWAEDTEYLQWRLGEQAKLPSHRVTAAKVEHAMVSRSGTPPTWKLYYETRNAVYLRLYLKRHDHWRLLRLLGYGAKQIVIHPYRLRRTRLALRGLHHGLTGRLGLTQPLTSD